MTEQQTRSRRVGADGQSTDLDEQQGAEGGVVVASIPGSNPDNFVTVTLAHPLNEADRVYLGLPADAKTEVDTQVKVNRNGANALINAGYAQVDPEDAQAVRSLLRGEPQGGEPTAEPVAEAPADPAQNPPQARSTPETPAPSAPKPAEKG